MLRKTSLSSFPEKNQLLRKTCAKIGVFTRAGVPEQLYLAGAGTILFAFPELKSINYIDFRMELQPRSSLTSRRQLNFDKSDHIKHFCNWQPLETFFGTIPNKHRLLVPI